MARPGLVTLCAVAALAVATSACSLPEAEEAAERTNEDAAHGKPFPTLAPAQAGAPTIEVVAAVEPKWEKDEFTAQAGVVNISFTSTGSSNHNLNLVGPGAPYPLLWGEDAGAPEEKLTKAVTLQKGTYTFYCSVAGHRSAGMEGTIVVS